MLALGGVDGGGDEEDVGVKLDVELAIKAGDRAGVGNAASNACPLGAALLAYPLGVLHLKSARLVVEGGCGK